MALNPPRLAIDRHERARLLVLRGDVDSHTAEKLDQTLEQWGTTEDVTLDLSGVEFIDSSGLRVVIDAHHRCEDAGVRLGLRAPSAPVDRLLDIAGLKDHLHIDGG